MGMPTPRKLKSSSRRRYRACADDIEAQVDYSLPPLYTANDSAFQTTLTPRNHSARLLMSMSLSLVLIATLAFRLSLISADLYLLALIATFVLHLILADLYTSRPQFNCWGLRNEDEEFASYFLSLACLFKLIFPDETLENLMREADKPPLLLIQHLCSTFTEELKLKTPTSSTGGFSTHITSIFDALRARQQIATLSCEEFEFTGSAESILQRVDSKEEKLPRGCSTTTHFAIFTGYFVGKRGQFVYPGISMGQIIQVATILRKRE